MKWRKWLSRYLDWLSEIGQYWPRAIPPAEYGDMHMLFYSGLPDGRIRARCEACPGGWARSFEGPLSHRKLDELMRMHSAPLTEDGYEVPMPLPAHYGRRK